MREFPASALAVIATLTALIGPAHATGSSSTLAISHGSATVCGVVAGTSHQDIQCARASASSFSSPFLLSPNASFSSISAGRDSICGLWAGGTAFLCWNATSSSSTTFPARRVYEGSTALEELAVGEVHIAALDRNRTFIEWWRSDGRFPSNISGSYHSLASGRDFSCALISNGSLRCWGPRGGEIEADFADSTMSTIAAGDSHVCGIDTVGRLICGGNNDAGQSTPPSSPAFEFGGLALGEKHSCAVRNSNGTVICWGGGVGGEYTPANATSFVLVVAGGNLSCGLATANFSVLCWGTNRSSLTVTLPLPRILPGICTSNQSSCLCGLFPDSETLCSDSRVICNRCDGRIQPSTPPHLSSPDSPPSLLPLPPPTSSKRMNRRWLAFAIVGSIGAFSGICSILYCIWFGVCRQKKVHNSVQPTIVAPRTSASYAPHSSAIGVRTSPSTSPSGSRSRTFWRQGSRIMRRQRSGPSSFKERPEEFSFCDLAVATKNFSSEAKLGAGSFGTVYKGKLPDGRQVAIKRSESGPRTKKFQEKESAFESELAFLSRLHHKHLVGLVGYCEEREERLLVYEYMKNGALYDHLHPKNEDSSSVLNSWKMRIRVLLDAARGIEYLHNYAVPPIIHRDIKSSNILLDANWLARVSDFGLSLLGPESGDVHFSMKAAGTVGYMDPEYYGMHLLTVKSDVYGLGVVMLEVLTGKRAIFKDEESGNPTSIVDYAVPSIVAGEINKVLDLRVGQPGPNEVEAVELVAYTAVHCVTPEGKNRPSMTDIVANLESALSLLLDGSRGSVSSACMSCPSTD
ncbi:putative serine/threonine-protein kinase-like protein CCR3 [Curcuma longa]|uniref:putative serine/threonine-protein kinase-like protein CCR3 n=1 Tax=Curcuma longa TaxID=136217 RepID=UPI003D9FAADA